LAALATRAPKPSNDAIGDAVDLRSLWRSQALAVGIDPDADVATVGRPRAVVISDDAASGLTERLVSAEGLTAQESVFERRDLIRAIAESMPDGAHLDALEGVADRVLAEPGVVELDGMGRGGEGLQTTRELLEVEAALLEVAAWPRKGVPAESRADSLPAPWRTIHICRPSRPRWCGASPLRVRASRSSSARPAPARPPPSP
jgi:hypothetical protein